jgi:RHS repeat-associated protein
MTYNAGNEQLNINTATFEYDLNGNRIQKTEGSTITSYTYDDENRLIQVSDGTNVVSYNYDPMGRRIEKNVNGTITSYVYDNEAIILEYNAAGNVKAKFTHGPGLDEPLAVKKSGDIYYYHADGLGSIVAITNTSGTKVKIYSYDSFGNMTKTGDIRQPFTYTAREFDSETGLYYYRARYYDARAGRFLQRDPIGLKGEDVNLYAYVENDPVNYFDPNGLLRYNKPAQKTIPPPFGVRLKLHCMEWLLGKNLGISGGAEQSGHTEGSKHYTGQAADISCRMNPGLCKDVKKVLCIARKCGFENARDETKTALPHIHVQTVPDNNGSKGNLPSQEDCECDK